MSETLRDTLLAELSRENMLQTIQRFSHLYRYSGTREGEEAAAYLREQLDRYGVPYESCTYDGFFSIPVRASLEVGGTSYRLIGDVYSQEADGLTGELFYDAWSEKKGHTQLENAQRYAAFRDKIVLTWDGKGDFALHARQAGAKGVVHICASRGGYIHHSNIGVVWGTPGLDDEVYMRFLPSAGISREDGESLIAAQKEEVLEVKLTIQMDTAIRKSSMVIAEIPGRSSSYVLVSGHYDSWYEGITDNAVSNAILLEYARILHAHQPELERGVKLAWWSGHSDGRFSGSTWYCDSHWRDLKTNCVAHVNLDLTGCKNSEQIVARTAGTEGIDYTARLIEKYTGQRPESYIPMVRGADQSFWGVDVPITIMLKYEPKQEKRLSNCPSGGPWWHTDQDTLDKLDETIMMRDARIDLELIYGLQSARVLPVQVEEFYQDMSRRLQDLLAALPGEFDCREIQLSWKELGEALELFAQRMAQGKSSDAEIKYTIGGLLHLIYCSKGPHAHDHAAGFGIFGAFRRMPGISRENTTPEFYTMAESEFLRCKNRLCDGLCEINQYIYAIMN